MAFDNGPTGKTNGNLTDIYSRNIPPDTPQKLSQSKGKNTCSVDAMASISLPGDTGNGFYGSSSTISFIHDVCKAASIDGSNDASLLQTQPLPNELAGATHRMQADFQLPERKIADNLFNCYWEIVHPLFPFIYIPRFRTSYELLWMSDSTGKRSRVDAGRPDPIFYSIVNIVFALGCQFCRAIPPGERARQADIYFWRSRRLHSSDDLNSGCLSSVQLLLLSGIYLQSTSYANMCWNIVGLAIRAAQGLGLHVEDSLSSKPRNQLERELKCRIWHGCVMLDR